MEEVRLTSRPNVSNPSLAFLQKSDTRIRARARHNGEERLYPPNVVLLPKLNLVAMLEFIFVISILASRIKCSVFCTAEHGMSKCKLSLYIKSQARWHLTAAFHASNTFRDTIEIKRNVRKQK